MIDPRMHVSVIVCFPRFRPKARRSLRLEVEPVPLGDVARVCTNFNVPDGVRPLIAEPAHHVSVGRVIAPSVEKGFPNFEPFLERQ
jgi:hypothetical protein